MEGPTPDEVRVVGMSTVASAHTIYVETVRANFGQSGLEAIGEANRLHGIELGKEGVESGALREGDLKSIYEFFAAAHPYFGFELDLIEVTDRLIDIKVTACPWIDTFKARGAKEDICHWVCKMDEGIAQAMDPELTMSIPKCMMRGDDHCIYRWEK